MFEKRLGPTVTKNTSVYLADFSVGCPLDRERGGGVGRLGRDERRPTR